jgi:hypothetical protein
MVNHRQRLPLGLKAGDDLPSVHAGLDDLQRHAAADRLGLLGHENDAKAPFSDLLEELVRPDLRAGAFGDWLIEREGDFAGDDWLLEKTVRLLMGAQRLNAAAQVVVVAANLQQPLVPLFGRSVADQLDEDFFGLFWTGVHSNRPPVADATR